ncbi:MAG TPA: (Fe-S)-binding protein [Polyangia bacterium]|nr:(Fe-S)-binding protein [Polyangia bacterium]
MSAPDFTGPNAPSLEDVAACVHCGMCLEACPTYKELRVEGDSPRGRLYLIRGLIEKKIEPSASVVEHLDRCLDCRACETACPSTVKYGEILEKTRTILQPSRRLSATARLVRWLAFRVVLPSRRAQTVAFKLLWFAQTLGLTRAGAWLARHGLAPRALADAPHVPFRSFRARQSMTVFPAKGARRKRVALFTGCVADQLFADVNDATVHVLTENGCEVHVLPDERCCGALHIHNGARGDAQALARDNVRAFTARDFDAVVSNAAGCGAELRHYGALLPDEPAAAQFGARVRDVSELLCELGLPPAPASAGPAVRVAYDEPCHLLHAQKVSDPPRQVLRAIDGVSLVQLDEADACCGGAGAYWLQQPELSAKVTARKLDAIRRSGAEIVATGNPGCLMQIRNAARAAGLPVRVAHPVVLLAEAYARRTP